MEWICDIYVHTILFHGVFVVFEYNLYTRLADWWTCAVISHRIRDAKSRRQAAQVDGGATFSAAPMPRSATPYGIGDSTLPITLDTVGSEIRPRTKIWRAPLYQPIPITIEKLSLIGTIEQWSRISLSEFPFHICLPRVSVPDFTFHMLISRLSVSDCPFPDFLYHNFILKLSVSGVVFKCWTRTLYQLRLVIESKGTTIMLHHRTSK